MFKNISSPVLTNKPQLSSFNVVFVFKTIVFTYFMRFGCSLGLCWYALFSSQYLSYLVCYYLLSVKMIFLAFETNNFQNLNIYMFTSNAKQTKDFFMRLQKQQKA
jgi:hypothetical protein